MAVRIRQRFHAAGRERAMAELASVVALLAWKLSQESIKRMRAAGFNIDIGRTYFDVVCESLAFHAHVADRVAYRELTPERREEFTRALALRLAAVVEENQDMLLAASPPGQCRNHFLELFNESGSDYAEHGYDAGGPDFGFRRCFAARLAPCLPERDRPWIYDQVIDVEAAGGDAIEKTLRALFARGDIARDGVPSHRTAAD